MPDWIAVILLGLIEGITEFIPVSSTGHLLIAEHWLPKQSDLFNVVIQCGAVVAVIPLFRARFEQFLFRWREKATQDFLLKIAVAFGITCVVCYAWAKSGHKLPHELLPIGLAVLAGGIGFVIIEFLLRGRALKNEITWGVVAAVAIGQILAAIFPGTSRSGATILLALVIGLNRPLATEFSFLVGIPTMLAAGAWEILKAVRHPEPGVPPEHWGMVALGTIVSALVSFIAVKWLLRYVQTHTFTAFGWYRIALAALIFALLLM